MTNSQGDFARKMAFLRGEGLSQNEAADLARISRTLWRNMEDPEYPYRARRGNVVKVARLLGWDLEEALRLAGYTEPPTDLELAEMSRGPRDDLDRLLRKLNEEQIRRLAAFVESMLNPNVLPNPDDDRDGDEVRPVHVQEVKTDAGVSGMLGTRMRQEREGRKNEADA